MQKKNKAKGKPARNPPPAQKTVATPSGAIPQPPPPVVESTSIKISEDHRVPEIKANPTAIDNVPEKEMPKNPQELGPVKPKRHRGGKKRKPNENKTETSEVEIPEISSKPIIIANVDIIETKQNKSLELSEKAPVIENFGENIEIPVIDDSKDSIQSKQPIAPKKKKGKHQQNEQHGIDSLKTASSSTDLQEDKQGKRESVEAESQINVDELKKSEVQKIESQKKESDNINVEEKKCEIEGESIKNVSKNDESQEKEECQTKEQANKKKSQKSCNKKSDPKEATKKKDELPQTCELSETETAKIEVQKSEPIMNFSKKNEIEHQKFETHKNKKQKNETKKENIEKSDPKSTEALKSEICKLDQSKKDVENSETSKFETTSVKCDSTILCDAQSILPEIIAKPESIKKEEDSSVKDLTGLTGCTEVESKKEEKCGKNRKYQKNKDNGSSVVETEIKENINLPMKESFKFAPDISVVTELPIIESNTLHKESLPKISEEQNKVSITEIIEKEVEQFVDLGMVSPDVVHAGLQPVKITNTSSFAENTTKGGKGKKCNKKQKDKTTDIADIYKESPTEKVAEELFLPTLTKEKFTDSSKTVITKLPEEHQSDIARNLKSIEDEMKIIMDLTPTLSNISLHAPIESENPGKEITIDLICEIPANIVSETSPQNTNKEATIIPNYQTKDSTLEMEMWKEVIEKSLREFTELESQNESMGMMSPQPFSTLESNPEISSDITQIPKLSTINIDTSDITLEEAIVADESIREKVECEIKKKYEEKDSLKTETKLTDTAPMPIVESIVVPILEVKSDAIMIDEIIGTQNISQEDQLASSHLEQKQRGRGKCKKGDKKNKQDASTTKPSQSSTAASSTDRKESEKGKSEPEGEKSQESQREEQKEKTSGETKDSDPSDQECTAIETRDSVKNTDNFEQGRGVSDMDLVILPTSSEGNVHDVQQEDPMLQSFIIPTDNDDLISQDTQPVDPKLIFKPNKENIAAENPICTPPKNLLGHPNIPVTSNKNDYKKEKNKNVEKINPSEAKIKMKDISKNDLPETSQKTVPRSLESQNEQGVVESDDINNNLKAWDSENEEEEYVYKYSFRKVFLANTCNICKADLFNDRIFCGYCNLVGYCGQRHKDDDWTQHQALCFAVSTIVHLKGLKFVYADAKSMSGHEYRLLRMQTIVSCEKILKRKLTPWEQEILLYPRMCLDSGCREFRPALLQDCKDCSQVSFCKENPAHLSLDHKKWCKSYKLYQKMVLHQQEKGRIEPKLPFKIITNMEYQMPPEMDTLLKQLYGNDFGVDGGNYAALTQIATAPLTALYGYHLYSKALSELSKEGKVMMNGIHQHSKFTVHLVGAELQFEADTLGKWEVFFLHLYPGVNDLTVAFIGPELNPSNLPLELLNKIRMCKACKLANRRVDFEFHDRILYHDFVKTDKFCKPDLVCAFNPGLHRTTGFSGLDSWPDTIRSIISLQSTPFCVTSYTKHELPRDLVRIKDCVNADHVKVYLEPTLNPYSSTRPDRNFISDDEMPLIFKNYHLMVVSG